MGAHRPIANVVIAVKDLADAKTRLAPAFSSPDRTRLVLAMLADTVQAALGVAAVHTVTVVTPDPLVTDTARALGARVITEGRPDHGRTPEERLNDAFTAAARSLRSGDDGVDVIALQADLPALRSDELAEAYGRASDDARSVVVDHHGTGTAALVLRGRVAELDPRFGVDSARRHGASGALRLEGSWPGLRLDVDTLDDVRQAYRLGVGPATATVLNSLGWDPSPDR